MGRVVLRGTPNWPWVGLKEVFQVMSVVYFKTACFKIFCYREDYVSKHDFTTHIISCWVSSQDSSKRRLFRRTRGIFSNVCATTTWVVLLCSMFIILCCKLFLRRACLPLVLLGPNFFNLFSSPALHLYTILFTQLLASAVRQECHHGSLS